MKASRGHQGLRGEEGKLGGLEWLEFNRFKGPLFQVRLESE